MSRLARLATLGVVVSLVACSGKGIAPTTGANAGSLPSVAMRNSVNSAARADVAAPVQSATARILFTFANSADGSDPQTPFASDSSGNIYGSAYAGGSQNDGVAFELTRSASDGDAGSSYNETVLYTFGVDAKMGINPGPLTRGPGGDLWGEDSAGIFRLSDVGGTWQAHLVDACGGAKPVTIAGGKIYAACGPFKDPQIVVISPGANGYSAQVAHTFSGYSGLPNGGLIVETDGTIWGSASTRGSCCGGPGPVYRLRPNASGGYNYKRLYDADTLYGPTIDGNGRIFTNEFDDGVLGCGNIEVATPIATGYTAKYATKSVCYGVGSPLLLPSGDIYYAAMSDVYQLAPNGTAFTRTIIHHFSTRGAGPVFNITPLFSLGDGNIYGATQYGGGTGCGGDGCPQFFVIYR